MRRSKLTSISFLFLLGLGLLSGCSSDEKKADGAETAYNAAMNFSKEERYEEAIRRFQEVKNKYPYSKFATLAELGAADAYFKQESFPEAQVAYQNFKDLHPKFDKIDYITYQLGLSYYNQLPDTPDRDLNLAPKTLVQFNEIINQYPGSQYVKEATEKRQAVLKLLAAKEIYIADFYYRKEKWDSARVRYENEVKNYPGQGLEARALSRAVLCAARASEMDRAKELLGQLKSQFPDAHSEIEDAEKEVK